MKRVWLLFCIMLLCSCARYPQRVFRQAESMLNTQPDSARMLLESISPEQLKSRTSKARYGLLFTMAKDKSYQDNLDTALIQASYDYYQHWGTQKQRMLSAYYLGIARQYYGQDMAATSLFRDAEHLAKELEDNRYAGLSCEHLSALYARNYDNDESLAAAKRAVHSFQKAGETLSADFSRLDIAWQYCSLEQFNEAEAIVDSLLSTGFDTNMSLRYALYLLKADLSYYQGHFPAAQSFYAKLEEVGGIMSISSLRNITIINERNKDRERTNVLLSRMSSQCVTDADSAAYYDCIQHVSILRKDTARAYENMLKVNLIQDRVVRAQLRRSIAHAQKNHYEQHYNLERKNKQLLLLSGVIVILTLAVVLLIILAALLRRKKQIILEMAKVNQLTEDIEDLNQTQKGNNAVIATLLQDKIKTMQALSTTYFNWSDDAFAKQEERQGEFTKDEILSSFRKHLRSLRSDEHFLNSLEHALDISSQNLIHRLRDQTTGPVAGARLKELDFQYLVLFFAGFSSKSISFLMDSTEDAVRARKSRYRKLFKSMGETGKEYWERLC